MLTGSQGGDKYFVSASDLGELNVVPVTFSDIPPPTGPVFLPSAPPTFDLEYSNTVWWGKPPRATAPGIRGQVDSSRINVMTAAAASSAASGFVASHGIVENNNAFLSSIPLTDWEIAFEADELALYFNMPGPADATARVTRSTTKPRRMISPMPTSDSCRSPMVARWTIRASPRW